MRERNTVRVELAPAELLDKLSILEIKVDRISEVVKRKNVLAELDVLREARAHSISSTDEVDALYSKLKAVNSRLWSIEDDIRLCEKSSEFGPKFVELARSVYIQNDERAALKREINLLLNSAILEEKSYEDY